jgi:tetratricopeptide (TPR) repeat protein
VLAAFGTTLLVVSRQVPATGDRTVNTDAAVALAVTLVQEQRPTSAGRVRATCNGAPAEPCVCVRVAVREALDASLVAAARGLVAAQTGACAESLAGLQAEIDARAGVKGAELKAKAALVAHPGDPHAAYALAHVAMARDDLGAATKWSEAAVASGRGGPAHLLTGLLALGQGEVEAARGAFLRVLETEPADVAALYNVALCEHRLNRYRKAREGYLAVLRKNPRHLDARFNIALLTHGAGFHEEAAHHLASLRQMAPGDLRVGRLEAMLTPPAPSASGAAAVGSAPALPR